MPLATTDKFIVSDGTLVLQLEVAEEGGYTVTSPFVPELVTEAESLEEAFEMARDAINDLTTMRSERSKRKRKALMAGTR
jgi:predicted RNase H-like HicB family nuclease